VTIGAVNDAPELALTAPGHAEAGVHSADAFGTVQAHDIDSAQLGGATITLSGAHPDDKLDFEGFTLHDQGGHLMIGDTGIEVVGGGYDSSSGSLTLSGNASPETYATVLQSLVLDSGDASGLGAGTRSIGVTLFDQEGAASVERMVDVVVDAPAPVQMEAAHADITAAGLAAPMQDNTAADLLLLMPETGNEATDSSTGAWTDQVDHGNVASDSSHATTGLDQPPSDQIQPITDFHADIGRVSWP
jgi:hypothetical protein